MLFEMNKYYKEKNPKTKYTGKHLKYFLQKDKDLWHISPRKFANKVDISSAYVYKLIKTSLAIRKKLLDRIIKVYPSFIK